MPQRPPVTEFPLVLVTTIAMYFENVLPSSMVDNIVQIVAMSVCGGSSGRDCPFPAK